ncbi:unnamed protein product [Paramecium sonneborni]|uniref:Transmembrane protein n=1 Tax=Paramecium sonneborni TaxID=65129 RepID=A0A8S1RJH3_9CILI|nr:unnamed protein product [Paramecium sonneborni]
MNQSENQFNFFNDVKEGNVEIKFNDKNFLQNYVTFIFQNSQYRVNKTVQEQFTLQHFKRFITVQYILFLGIVQTMLIWIQKGKKDLEIYGQKIVQFSIQFLQSLLIKQMMQ